MSRNRWRFSKPTIAVGIFGLAVGLLAGLTVFTFGQQRPEGGRLADPRDSLHVPILTFGPQGPAELVGVPDDWTYHHLVFSNPGTEEQAFENGSHDRWLEIVNDPRFILQGLKRNAAARGFGEESTGGAEAIASREITEAREAAEGEQLKLFPIRKPSKPPKGKIEKDWGEGLNTGTINPNTFPAKWSFSTSSASCANDFVIYPSGMAGTTSQASIIAYYNLYSGCTSPVPKVNWAYNTGGTVSLSPVFSLTGSQVAFIQTSSSAVASLVLLRFPLTPPGTGTLTSPIAPTSESTASAYYNSGAGCTAPCMYTMTLSGSPNDTWSSPYYDSWTDSLYVGDAAGKLHKFNPVFNGTPAEVTSSWPVQLVHSSTNDTTQTTSPVYDPSSGKVFVGTFGGYLYSVGSGNKSTTSGTIYGGSIQLDTAFGIRDAVLVDPTASMVYAFVGYDSTTSHDSGVYQFSTGFTSSDIKEVQVSAGASTAEVTAYQMSGAFDNTYYTSSTPSSPSGNLYVCSTYYPATLYQIAISGNAMGTVTTEPTLGDTSYYGRCSPITEFFNTSVGSATGTVTIQTNPGGSSPWPAGEQVTIGTTTYTFVTTLSAANQVLLYTASGTGSTNEDRTAENLRAAVNATSSQCYASPCYGTGTSANTSATATWTTGSNAVTLTATTPGTAGDFTLSTNYSTGIAVSGGSNGGTDYIFLSTFAGSQTGCTQGASDGCIMSFNVTTPSAVALSGTSLNVTATTHLAPTGGLIIDNSVGSGTLAGASQIYFLTTDSSSSVSCSTSGTGVCAVQASQTSP